MKYFPIVFLRLNTDQFIIKEYVLAVILITPFAKLNENSSRMMKRLHQKEAFNKPKNDLKSLNEQFFVDLFFVLFILKSTILNWCAVTSFRNSLNALTPDWPSHPIRIIFKRGRNCYDLQYLPRLNRNSLQRLESKFKLV